MSAGKKAFIIGGVVALIVLGLLLPLKGRVTYWRDLEWIPREDDPTVLADYIEERVEVVEVDQLYPLQILVEKEGYKAFFFAKAKGSNAVAVWLVRVPGEDEEGTILKHEKEVVPRLGLQVVSTSVEDETLIATTAFDGGGLFISVAVAAGVGILFALIYDSMRA